MAALVIGLGLLYSVSAAPGQSTVWAVREDTAENMTENAAESTAAQSENEKQSSDSAEKLRQDAQGRPILGDGESGILIEAKSGTVLYESDSQKRVYPASTTKIMTGLLAVEAMESGEISADTEVEVTAEMLEGLDPDSSNMELKAGEIISFENLLKGLMIPSGNDAAMAIAYRLSGTPEAFVERMNARAAALHMDNTHFANAHGLHDDNHYTTAADMAKLSREAMQHEGFRDVVDIAHVKMAPTNKTEKQRYYINTNGLLSAMRYREYVYQGATGIKTGHTSQAGNCLVGSAVRGNMELIAAVFGGKEIADSHQDTKRMLDYGFSAFELIVPIQKGEMMGEVKVKRAKSRDRVTLSVQEPVTVVVPKGTKAEELEMRLDLPEAVYAPVSKGQNVGSVTVLNQGQELGSGQLYSDLDIRRSFFWPAMALGEWLWSFWAVRILCYLLLGILCVFLVIAVCRIRREIKRQRRIRQQRRIRGERK